MGFNIVNMLHNASNYDYKLYNWFITVHYDFNTRSLI